MIHYQLTHPDAQCITKSRETSAAYDIYTPEYHIILPGEVKQINTHFRTQLAVDTFAMIVGRSKLGTRGMVILGGIIDSDYRGDWIVCCSNIGMSHISFEPGDAIAQILILPIINSSFHLVEKLDPSLRGSSGILDAGERK